MYIIYNTRTIIAKILLYSKISCDSNSYAYSTKTNKGNNLTPYTSNIRPNDDYRLSSCKYTCITECESS